MKRVPVLAIALAMIASLASACSTTGTSLPGGGSHDGNPAILQRNERNRWVTLTAVGRGTPYAANVLAGRGVIYVVAGWGKVHRYESFATIDMNGAVSHAPRQPTCSYVGSISGTYHLYAYDIALNHEGNSVFVNPDITFPGLVNEFGWTFVAPTGKRSACYLADVSAGNVSVLATGPEDTIWGAGAASPYLWKFSADGSATNFALPAGVSGFGSLVEGPDRAMWAQPENAATVMRISPGSGRVLNTYEVPCALPVHALAVAYGLVWGYANGCIYSISPSGATRAYAVGGMVAEDSPHAIAAGPDGDPWFVERAGGSAGAIGTIAPSSGKSRKFALPAGASVALALGTGPDRNLWITDKNDDVYVYVPNPLRVDPGSVTLPQIRAVARLKVTETGITAWKATSANTAVARVKQSSTPSIFLVIATGSGSTTVTFRDATGNSVVVPVTVD